MKLFSQILLMLFSLTISTFSQNHQAYFSAGYSIPTTTSVLSTSHYDDQSFDQLVSTYSKGFMVNGGYQFVVNNNFILDLGLNYFFGNKHEKYFNTEVSNSYYTNSSFSIVPTVNIKFDIGSFSPYTKFGCSFNLIKLQMDLDVIGSTRFKYEYIYKGNVAIGFVGGIGVNYLFNQSLVGFIEAQLNSLTYYPSELQLTQILSNGEKNTTTIKLKENFDYNNTNEHVIPSEDFPFSSLSVILGLRVVL